MPIAKSFREYLLEMPGLNTITRTTSGYTDKDREKLFNVMNKLGMKPKDAISNGSHETDGTNTVSPVKGFKGY